MTDMPMPPTPERASQTQQRAAIRQTVERMVPQVEIDQTKVLTDEEYAALRAQWDEQKAARELAEREGRTKLKERISKAAQRIQKTGPVDPEELRKRLS